MKINIRRHPGTPTDTVTYEHEVGPRIDGPGSDFAWEEFDTGASIVEIWDAFVGPVLRNGDTCLAVFARDDGFEFNCWRQPEAATVDLDMALPDESATGRVSPAEFLCHGNNESRLERWKSEALDVLDSWDGCFEALPDAARLDVANLGRNRSDVVREWIEAQQLQVPTEPSLGLATTAELVLELVARWQTSRLGVLDPQYSTVPRSDVVRQRNPAGLEADLEEHREVIAAAAPPSLAEQFAELIWLYGPRQLTRNMTTEQREAYDRFTERFRSDAIQDPIRRAVSANQIQDPLRQAEVRQTNG